MKGIEVGVDDDGGNALSRACRHLLVSGEFRSHLVAVLFKGPSGFPRWLGVFAEAADGDVFFFPGFLDSYRFVVGSGQSGSESFGGSLEVDHLVLDRSFSAWRLSAVGGAAHQDMPPPVRVGRDQVLWFGMTANVARLFRVARSDTRLSLAAKGTGVEATLRAALDGMVVEVLTFEGDPDPDKHAPHFAVFIRDADARAYSGPTLGMPDEASPFVRMRPNADGSRISVKRHSFRLARRAVQVATTWLPVEVTTGITFTCPGTSIERASRWLFVLATLTRLMNVLRSLWRVPGHKGRLPSVLPQAPSPTVAPTEAPAARNEQMHVWVKPANVQLPLRKSPFRFAAGHPDGASSNSWVVSVERKGDIYVACRDNFRDVKVSLHASGRWRFALTEQAIKSRPELLPPGADRVWDRWAPPPDHDSRLVIAFQVVFPSRELYLRPENRTGWKPIVFVEPSSDLDTMVVVSVCVVPSLDPVQAPADVEASGLLAVIPVDAHRSVQLVAHYEAAIPFEKLRNDGLQTQKQRLGIIPGTVPDDAVVVLWGTKSDGTRWLSAARFWPYG